MKGLGMKLRQTTGRPRVQLKKKRPTREIPLTEAQVDILERSLYGPRGYRNRFDWLINEQAR